MVWRTGELDQRLKFKRPQFVTDEGGGRVKTFTEIFEVWGKVKTKSGREYNDNDQVEPLGNYQFVIRWRDDFTEADLIEWNGQDYNIRFIEQMGGRRLYLSINAERGVAQ
jgi:SPP1 family predicted phage head-tail adaptor